MFCGPGGINAPDDAAVPRPGGAAATAQRRARRTVPVDVNTGTRARQAMSEQGSHAAPTTIEALEETLNESVAAQTAAAEITTRVAVRLIAALARKLHPGATRVNLDDSDQGPPLTFIPS